MGLLDSAYPGGAERLELKRCAIVVDDAQPSYVQHAVGELQGYLQETTGAPVPVKTAQPDQPGLVIGVGPTAFQHFAGQPEPKPLGDEGFIIRTQTMAGARSIAATGAGPQGTKFAVAALMHMIRVEGPSVYLPAGGEMSSVPRFARRGIHLNGWPFKYPYTFRGWREADWRCYIDTLTCQGVNLFYLWPFMEIMPTPLSAADQSYLEEVRRVVEYAQQQHGMEVWIMQAVNRVAQDDCGVRDPRQRPYWRPCQVDLNPGDPAQFELIAGSHETLYRIVNNADGYCFIDCDPGGWPGSPVGDLMRVFRHTRACLDRYSRKGAATKLVHWLWGSWGHVFAPLETRERVVRETLRAMRAELPEPWGLICGLPEYLPWCQDEGVLAKTVYLPYDTIEGEPSYPGTNLDLPRVRHSFATALRYPGLLGVMANVQTPLLQFPHLFCWHRLAWAPECAQQSQADLLAELGRHVYPEHADLIAAAWAALSGAGDAELRGLAQQLDDVLRRGALGRAGLLGRKLFPAFRTVAQALVFQLRLRAAHEALLGALRPATDETECVRLVQAYLDAYLAWDVEHGWHDLWGYGFDRWPLGRLPEDKQFAGAVAHLKAAVGGGAALDACLEQMRSALAPQYGERRVVEGGVEPLRRFVSQAES
jgi:hypothetical protein